jgi:hypothetical protein
MKVIKKELVTDDEVNNLANFFYFRLLLMDKLEI